MMEEDYSKIFYETFVRTMHDSRSSVAEDMRASRTAANRPFSEPGRRSPDVWAYLTSRQIATITGIHRSSVVRII